MIILTVIGAWLSYILLRTGLGWTVETLVPCSVEVHRIETSSLSYNWLLQRRALVWIAGLGSAIRLDTNRLPHRGDFGIVQVYRLGGLVLRTRVLRIEADRQARR